MPCSNNQQNIQGLPRASWSSRPPAPPPPPPHRRGSSQRAPGPSPRSWARPPSHAARKCITSLHKAQKQMQFRKSLRFPLYHLTSCPSHKTSILTLRGGIRSPFKYTKSLFPVEWLEDRTCPYNRNVPGEARPLLTSGSPPPSSISLLQPLVPVFCR